MNPSPRSPEELEEFLVADVGSTTTKVALFTKRGGWRFVRAESPTTVEKPCEDVAVGLLAALDALAAKTGRTLVAGDRPALPLFATSSAGGGLALVAAGLVREITASSAHRAALGAGAVVLDVLALNDGRTPYRKIEDLKVLRPDLVLLAGGFDGDNLTGPVFLAELVREAGLCPKLCPGEKLPVVYAGNVHAREFVRTILGDSFLVRCVPNLRPDQGTEDIEPCRKAIHELFMAHVMARAPGFSRITEWTAAPVLPTPAAFAKAISLLTEDTAGPVLAVDIGGATTDVFTAEAGEVHRTVSANIGMSYSLLEVLKTVGPDAILDLLAEPLSPLDIWNRLGAKHARPTTLPATALDMRIEWATAAVAIREAVRAHFRVLRGDPPAPQDGVDVNDLLRDRRPRVVPRPPPDVGEPELIVGSGGILSHSPPGAVARMLLDGLQPPDGTALAADNDFVLPHLGALAAAAPGLARELIRTLGLVPLGRAGYDRPVWPTDYVPPARPAATPDPPRRGPIRFVRELAIPGEILVAPGDAVDSGTLVARSTRLFLRPFFLKVAETLGIPPEELPSCLRTEPGEFVEAGDLIAELPRRGLFRKAFHSPVSGRVERILPGVVVLREDPDAAREYATVDAARDLDVVPSNRATRWSAASGSRRAGRSGGSGSPPPRCAAGSAASTISSGWC
ncbi:MAG: glutamate mutase L [Planctomycetes bacterium]|nr:glutamate mutase L [Planctomycetota bacterium]